MAEKPIAPSGDFELKDSFYAQDSVYSKMTEYEFVQGRNNTGEVETPLGSVPNAIKENWLLCYLNQHINYLTQMVEYLEDKIEGA